MNKFRLICFLLVALLSSSAFAQKNPHNNASMDAALMKALQGVRIWTPVNDSDLPAKTVSIRVEDMNGKTLADQEVRLGIMRKSGERKDLRKKSDENGIALFENLDVGEAQAYRPTATFEGATYGGTPFRLPEDKGRALVFQRIPTTDDQTMLLQSFGQTLVDLAGDRVRVVQESTIMNMTSMRGTVATIVLPEQGLKMKLPKGALNFQTERTMDDFRIVQKDDELLIKGSFSPGAFRLRYSFDLKPDGKSLEFTMPVPLSTIRYRVLMREMEGLSFSADGFPAPERMEARGQGYFATETQRKPSDDRLEKIQVRVTGLPSAGPWRLIAIGIALVLALLFLFVAFGRVGKEAFAQERERLIKSVKELDQAREKGAIGEKFHHREREETLRRLAILLEDSQS